MTIYHGPWAGRALGPPYGFPRQRGFANEAQAILYAANRWPDIKLRPLRACGVDLPNHTVVFLFESNEDKPPCGAMASTPLTPFVPTWTIWADCLGLARPAS